MIGFFSRSFWTKDIQIFLKMKNKFSHPVIFHKQMAFLRLKLAFLSKIIILWDLVIVRNVVRFKKHKICGTISLSIHVGFSIICFCHYSKVRIFKYSICFIILKSELFYSNYSWIIRISNTWNIFEKAHLKFIFMSKWPLK